jgi:hypothetical protein
MRALLRRLLVSVLATALVAGGTARSHQNPAHPAAAHDLDCEHARAIGDSQGSYDPDAAAPSSVVDHVHAADYSHHADHFPPSDHAHNVPQARATGPAHAANHVHDAGLADTADHQDPRGTHHGAGHSASDCACVNCCGMSVSFAVSVVPDPAIEFIESAILFSFGFSTVLDRTVVLDPKIPKLNA